jgi:hypothetical protein
MSRQENKKAKRFPLKDFSVGSEELAQIGFRAKDRLIVAAVFAAGNSRMRVFNRYSSAQLFIFETVAENTYRWCASHKHW